MNLSLTLKTMARLTPHAPALSFEGRRLSYGAFEHQAACIAGALLAKRGLTAGDRVAIVMENALEYLPALYGIWRAGLCAVPIDAKLQAKEIAWILADCEAKLAFVSRTSADRLSGSVDAPWPPVVIAGSRDWMAMLFADPVTTAPAASEGNAWIFYSNDIKGRPKGAILTHRQLEFASLAYYADIDQLEAGGFMVHAAQLSHAAGLYALAHVAKGSHQIIFPSFEAERVAEILASRENVSVFVSSEMLVGLLNHSTSNSLEFPGLTTIIYSGASINLADLERAISLFGPKLFHVYGRVESAMTIAGLPKSFLTDRHNADYDKRLVSAGLPRTGVAVKIVGADGTELPAGEIGEVITRSEGVMTGYWNNPEATNAALRDGWLWTGDRGSIDAAGFLSIEEPAETSPTHTSAA